MSAPKTSPVAAKQELELMSTLWSPQIAEDPLAFVTFAFPWGQKGTPLERHTGPRKWQRKILIQIKQHIAENKVRMARGEMPLVLQIAVCSGRGIGKSSLVAWLNLWFLSCVLGGSCINTANTEVQLSSKTWAELGKWHTLLINSHWFERTALSLRPADWFKEKLATQLKIDTGYYYSLAQLWSEDNPDAFAGAHNMAGMLLIYDEASGIPKPIWTVSEGFFTEPVLHRYWFVFSNGRRNTGPFFECFHKMRKWWARHQIDSRTVEGTDSNVYAQIIEKHGEDSDEARIEVKGQFPRQGDKQFISREIVTGAQERELEVDAWAGMVMGVDPARFGDDTTVIRFRQGRDARSIPPIEMKGADNMQVANKCAELIDKFQPDAVCVDAGNGTGIIDRLREMGYKVVEVWFGAASPEPAYFNFRTYLWAQMRDWLGGGAIDDNSDLETDLTAPEYKFVGDKQRLETKEELKARGFSSPDNADALSCTFATRVARRDNKLSRNSRKKHKIAPGTEYNIFGG